MDKPHQAQSWSASESNSSNQGSVRDARERVRVVGERLEPPPRAPGRPRPADSPQKGILIPRPSPTPQWPLQEEAGTGSNEHRPVVLQKPPPRRPPRPRYVPSLLDASKEQGYIPTSPYQQQQALDSNIQWQDAHVQHSVGYWEAKHGSFQEPDTPGTGLSGASMSSRRSTTSSSGSIPDFPAPTVPIIPQFQRQTFGTHPPPQGSLRRSIGPPPSSRRGASSYYSHNSYVTPIPEEVPESPREPDRVLSGLHGSYSSSHEFPQNWSDGPPDYYTNYTDDDEDGFLVRDGSNSRESDHDESSNLVRKASVGKQYKPTLTTVHSSSSLKLSEAKYSSVPKLPEISAKRRGQEPLAASTKLITQRFGGYDDSSEGESNAGADEHEYTTDLIDSKYSQQHSQGEQDPRIKQIMGGLEKGGAIERGFTPPKLMTPASIRNPKLDIDAVHEAEARGSLTSLTDLIRRATRVRSNLDRGKTASRLGMLDFGASKPNSHALQRNNVFHRRSSDSLSGILASFPAPTPQGDRPYSRWPSPFSDSNLHSHTEIPGSKEAKNSKRTSRRCCGLPLWASIALFILMLCLVAAAITVPLVLIVFPRQHGQQVSSRTDLSQCVEEHQCANSGQSVVYADSCSCICTGGFTGSNCSRDPELDCATTDIEGFTDATTGPSIPRLLSSAERFSVSLNVTALLASFSLSNLSCSDEEALVTFNGRTQRRGVSKDVIWRPTVTAAPLIIARDPQLSIPSIITSNGVILDPSGETPIPTAQRVDGTVPASTSTSPTSPSNTATPDTNDFEFARVAILWVMQETGLDAAVDAQQALREELSNARFAAQGINVGNGITIDMSQQTILSNGTIINT